MWNPSQGTPRAFSRTWTQELKAAWPRQSVSCLCPSSCIFGQFFCASWSSIFPHPHSRQCLSHSFWVIRLLHIWEVIPEGRKSPYPKAKCLGEKPIGLVWPGVHSRSSQLWPGSGVIYNLSLKVWSPDQPHQHRYWYHYNTSLEMSSLRLPQTCWISMFSRCWDDCMHAELWEALQSSLHGCPWLLCRRWADRKVAMSWADSPDHFYNK